MNIAGNHAGHPKSFFSPYKNKDLPDGPKGEYLTDRLTDETISFIEQYGDKPFFVYLSHYGVHTPLEGKPEKVSYYEEKIAGIDFEGEPFAFDIDGRRRVHQDNAVYAAMVESVDESLGIISCYV